MIVPHYWNPQQVERLLASLAALGRRRARVAALIMWRSGLRVGKTVALEWRDIDVTAGSLLVRRGKGGPSWLTTAGIPLNVVSQWLGHATPEVTLRTYLPIVGSTHSMADVP